jgi:hypothetical protein
MLHSSRPDEQEEGFSWLESRAHELTPELLSAFEREPDLGLRAWILELLAGTRREELLPFFKAQLGRPELRYWAASGLRKLGMKEAKRALFEAGEQPVTPRGGGRPSRR